MTPTPNPKALEAAARSMFAFEHRSMQDWTFDQEAADPTRRKYWMDTARAAVSAYLAAAPSDELWVGEYMLRRGLTNGIPTNGIWIGRPGGEGGQFATDDVERVIAQFYRENF